MGRVVNAEITGIRAGCAVFLRHHSKQAQIADFTLLNQPRLNRVAMRDFPVAPRFNFVLRKIRAHVFHLHLLRSHTHSQITRARQLFAFNITVLVVGRVTMIGRHGQFLVNHPITLLLAVKMIVPLKKTVTLCLTIN